MHPTQAFRISPLSIEEFAPLFPLSDGELRARGMRRVVADSRPGFPCRVSLQDAEPGERLILLPYVHHPVAGPYRASGPIYVREDAAPASVPVNEVPESLRSRLLSVRAYDAEGMLVASDVAEGRALTECVGLLFWEESVAYLHAHHARAGCYSCRIDRA